MPANDPTHKSTEYIINESTLGGPSQPTEQREVALSAAGVTVLTPTSGCKIMYIYNDTGNILRVGGSDVGASTGFELFNKSTLKVEAPKPGFTLGIYNPTSTPNLDIVEFF